MNADMHPRDLELVGEAVEVFRLLADETRLRVLCLLLDAELTVGELAERLDRPAPGVSQHLARLRRGRLVATRREGHHVHYSIADDHAAQMVTDALRHAEHAVRVTLEHSEHVALTVVLPYKTRRFGRGVDYGNLQAGAATAFIWPAS
ncbi:ArsR/SmtB family transcription factor [Janibacter terrae]|uniref:ArsR/SmtB family transcription factor n=1 Tax=Janibacter terrae TaxID=103817 RepID=UPI0009EF4559|nr:metalloregulator ArsR/SmtB family transcription factor [Janibacter terrae]